MGFSYFEFKIRLISLNNFLTKNKNSSIQTHTLLDWPLLMTITTKTEKIAVTFSHAWLILVEFTSFKLLN